MSGYRESAVLAQYLIRNGVLWAAFLVLLTAFLSLNAQHKLRDAVMAKSGSTSTAALVSPRN